MTHPQRWTGHVEPSGAGGFVALGDYLRLQARVAELKAAFDAQTDELNNAVLLLEELVPEHALEFRRRTYPDLYPR